MGIIDRFREVLGKIREVKKRVFKQEILKKSPFSLNNSQNPKTPSRLTKSPVCPSICIYIGEVGNF